MMNTRDWSQGGLANKKRPLYPEYKGGHSGLGALSRAEVVLQHDLIDEFPIASHWKKHLRSKFTDEVELQEEVKRKSLQEKVLRHYIDQAIEKRFDHAA